MTESSPTHISAAASCGAPAAEPAAEAEVDGRGLNPLWVVFGLALLVRVAYLFDAQQLAFFHHPVGDAKAYDDWARRIAGGQWWGPTTFYQAPLYPYVLALLYKVLGHNVWWPRVFQCVTSAVACVLLASAAGRFGGRRAVWIAGVVAALYAPGIFFDGLIQKASLGFFLVSVMIRLLADVAVRPSGRTGFWLGVVCGLLCLTRENALAIVPVLAVWLWWRHRPVGELAAEQAEPSGQRGARWVSPLVFLEGVAISLSPAVLHNYTVAHEWTLTTFQLGPNSYMGNHEGVRGWMDPIVPRRETPEFERADATRLAEEAMGGALTPAEVSRYWLGRSLDYIRHQPVEWLKLLARKWWLVWNRYEIPDTESYELYRAHSRILTVFGWVLNFGTLCPLALIAFVSARSRVRSWVVLPVLAVTMAAAVTLFFVSARYRFPLVPFLVVLAGIGLADARRVVSAEVSGGEGRRRVGRLSAAVAVVVVSGVWCHWPVAEQKQLEAGQWGNLGAVLAQQGSLDDALPCFRRAVEMYPAAPRLRAFLADALSIKRRFAEAIPHYRALLAIEPNWPSGHFNYAVALEGLGRVSEAVEQYRLAAVIDPGNEEARRALERLTFRSSGTKGGKR